MSSPVDNKNQDDTEDRQPTWFKDWLNVMGLENVPDYKAQYMPRWYNQVAPYMQAYGSNLYWLSGLPSPIPIFAPAYAWGAINRVTNALYYYPEMQQAALGQAERYGKKENYALEMASLASAAYYGNAAAQTPQVVTYDLAKILSYAVPGAGIFRGFIFAPWSFYQTAETARAQAPYMRAISERYGGGAAQMIANRYGTLFPFQTPSLRETMVGGGLEWTVSQTSLLTGVPFARGMGGALLAGLGAREAWGVGSAAIGGVGGLIGGIGFGVAQLGVQMLAEESAYVYAMGAGGMGGQLYRSQQEQTRGAIMWGGGFGLTTGGITLGLMGTAFTAQAAINAATPFTSAEVAALQPFFTPTGVLWGQPTGVSGAFLPSQAIEAQSQVWLQQAATAAAEREAAGGGVVAQGSAMAAALAAGWAAVGGVGIGVAGAGALGFLGYTTETTRRAAGIPWNEPLMYTPASARLGTHEGVMINPRLVGKPDVIPAGAQPWTLQDVWGTRAFAPQYRSDLYSRAWAPQYERPGQAYDWGDVQAWRDRLTWGIGWQEYVTWREKGAEGFPGGVLGWAGAPSMERGVYGLQSQGVADVTSFFRPSPTTREEYETSGMRGMPSFTGMEYGGYGRKAGTQWGSMTGLISHYTGVPGDNYYYDAFRSTWYVIHDDGTVSVAPPSGGMTREEFTAQYGPAATYNQGDFGGLIWSMKKEGKSGNEIIKELESRGASHELASYIVGRGGIQGVGGGGGLSRLWEMYNAGIISNPPPSRYTPLTHEEKVTKLQGYVEEYNYLYYPWMKSWAAELGVELAKSPQGRYGEWWGGYWQQGMTSEEHDKLVWDLVKGRYARAAMPTLEDMASQVDSEMIQDEVMWLAANTDLAEVIGQAFYRTGRESSS